MEDWREIDGYDNYMVSSLGRVKNVKTGKMLKVSLDGGGYMRLQIINNEGVSKQVLVHRLVAKAFLDDADDVNATQIDHINHQRADNNYLNLRYATRQQNQQNKPKTQRNTTSRFKGVYWNKRDKLWCAMISLNRNKIYLGTFRNEKDAGRAYDLECNRLFADFGCPNIISDDEN